MLDGTGWQPPKVDALRCSGYGGRQRRPLRFLSASRARFSILSRRMAADRATLKAQPRTEFGSRESRRLRREGLVPGVVYGGGDEARAFQAAGASGAQRARPRRRPDRRRDRGLGRGPGGDQGAAARPGARPPDPPRPARGQARRGDRGRRHDRADRRRGRPRRQGGRRARARHARDHDLGPADRDPRVDPRRRLRHGDRRHASAQRPDRRPRASSSSSARTRTPTRSRSPPSRRRASRRSPSPSSRRRPSWSARRARSPRARRRGAEGERTGGRATPPTPARSRPCPGFAGAAATAEVPSAGPATGS